MSWCPGLTFTPFPGCHRMANTSVGWSGTTPIWFGSRCSLSLLPYLTSQFSNTKPWDTTSLFVAELNEDGTGLVPGSKRLVAGGDKESVVYPTWSMDNRLTFISDRSNWWNLYQLDAAGNVIPLCPKEAEFCGPHWEFGNTPYAFVPGTDSIIVAFAENGKGRLGLVDPKTGEVKTFETGFTAHSNLNVNSSGKGTPPPSPIFLLLPVIIVNVSCSSGLSRP